MKRLKTLFVLWLAGLLVVPFVGGIEGGHPALYEAYKGLEEFGVEDAWEMGYTGSGVKVGIIDGGIDFATPDLIGTQARISDVNSPYDGWPIVIDLKSLSSYQQGILGYGSQYADTASTDVKGYNVTGTSKSGKYHTGDHPDHHLANFYGQPVKVLVVDEKCADVYDTVYVDLNNNHDFRDDKPCRKGDEISYWDRDDDSYPDESGGMIYFIADGETPLPISRMLYGKEAKIPEKGELVAFHFDPGSHGTMCASTIVAQGKNVKGIAPGARLIPVRSFGSNDMLLNLLASLGYDGIPGTGDEADIISRSGCLSYFDKGADEVSTFLEYLTTDVSSSTTIVYGNGNFGSGYGTCASPSSEHVINAGAIYDLWWNNSSYRGDVACFSSRGPNALGQVKPNVLATGYWAPAAKPLWQTHSGKAAWDRFGGGTSTSTPHVSAVVALIYQAYKETYGEFPTSEKARDILMSSATDIDEEVFAQGSGIINAKRAVEIASRKDGVLIEPALLVTPPVEAGSTLEFNFTISNYSDKPIIFKPQILIKKTDMKVILKSQMVKESAFFPVSSDMLDRNLMKISLYYPRDARNTKLDVDEGYDLYLYNWKDLNGDGNFGSGEPIPTQAQEGELETIAIGEWGSGFTSEVRMHNPAERTDDGVVIGLKRRGETESDKVNVVIESYSWVPWDIGMNVDGDRLGCSIPTPDTTGVYQGRILLEGDDEKKQCIPISFSTYRDGEIKIDDSWWDIYKNAKIYGRFEGDGTHGFWDSRFYPIYHQGDDLAIIEVAWEDMNTDIDVYLYGESVLNFSKLWKYPTEPPIELPELSVLKENGHSMRIWRTILEVSAGRFYAGSGYSISYNTFYTSTGENREVIIGELTDGLNILVLNEVISGGNEYGEDLTIKIKVAPLTSIDLRAKAGETINLHPGDIDGIVGFSSGEVIAGEPKTIEAKKGDVILIRSNSTHYKPHIFFDANGNGTLDWDVDDVIFAERRVDYINQPYTDIISIRKNGTYFLFGSGIEFYHMKDRYEGSAGAPMKIKAPDRAGAYLGIAEKDENLIPIPVKLTVDAGEPVSIHVAAPERIGCNMPFDVMLEVYDRFGNLIEDTVNTTVEFDNMTNNIEVIKGNATTTLTAPGAVGRYKINAYSLYGAAETDIVTTDEAVIEIGNVPPGAFSVIPDEVGEIKVNDRDYVIEGENETLETGETTPFVIGTPSVIEKESPGRVESVSILSTDGNITIYWQPLVGSDHYNVYRLRGSTLKKLAEAESPEYTMKGELWSTYTFRISAVNGAGTEGVLSDPVGVVVTP